MEPLVYAIQRVDLNGIDELLALPSAREIVNKTDSEMYTPIFFAARLPEDSGLEVMTKLLRAGADPYHKEENRQSVIFYLSKDGKARMVDYLLTNYQFNINEPDKYNQNPLYWAAKFGKLKVAEVLVKHGVNVNHYDNLNQTCLFWAAAQGHLEMCKFLIVRGCKYDHVDNIKKTPLVFAREKGHKQVAEYLTMLKKQGKGGSKDSKIKGGKASESKDIKKKETLRQEYILVHTNQEGEVREMKAEEVEDFATQNEDHAQLYTYMCDPVRLEQVETPHEKKFIKSGLRLVNNLLKRLDLGLFHYPVSLIDYPDYIQYVEHPMDYTTIKTKLTFNCYMNEQELKEDFLLVYQNCITYNLPESQLGQMAQRLIDEFELAFNRQMMS